MPKKASCWFVMALNALSLQVCLVLAGMAGAASHTTMRV